MLSIFFAVFAEEEIFAGKAAGEFASGDVEAGCSTIVMPALLFMALLTSSQLMSSIMVT